MIRGMTAYSVKERKLNSWIVTTEVWSYNHKFLRVNLSVPLELRKYSEEVERMIRGRISRGKINLKLEFSDSNKTKNKKVICNKSLADEIYKIGQKVKKNDEKSLQMRDVLLIPGVLEISDKVPKLSKHWPEIKKLIEDAIFELFKIKQKQGKKASKDLKSTVSEIKKSLKKIKKTHEWDKKNFCKKLNKKINQITKLDVSEEKIEEEVINYVRNKDINEEVTRVSSYLDLLSDLLNSNDAVGKKIDFIAQELLRETNTLGAKKSNVKVKKEVVDIKEKIENIREHSQNIE